MVDIELVQHTVKGPYQELLAIFIQVYLRDLRALGSHAPDTVSKGNQRGQEDGRVCVEEELWWDKVWSEPDGRYRR